MARVKSGISSDGRQMHYSVGAIIKRDDKYLLLDRATIPYGWAGPAGHVAEEENPFDALKNKVRAETNLEIIAGNILIEEEVLWNYCSAGVPCHYWHLFRCDTKGHVMIDSAGAKGYRWCSSDDLLSLDLEPVWNHWFEKLNII